MAEINHVVVHLVDGRLVKGTTHDFAPGKPAFHVVLPERGTALEVQVNKMKAVFFVRNLDGNPRRPKLRGFLEMPGENKHGKKIAVLFKDGELLCGYTVGYTRGRQGFFMVPADTGGNNVRIYVIEASTSKIELGPRADALLQEAPVHQRV